MRKFLSLLTMCLLAVTAIHAETFVMADQSGLPDGKETSFSLSFGTYTMTASKAGASNNPTYNTNGKDIRVYAKGTVQLTTTGSAMTQIVFNISDQGKKRLTDITASTGSVSIDNTAWTVTWTGSATDVTFTVGDKATYGTDGETKAGQLDFLSLDINTGAVSETVSKPAITPAAGTYYAPINVSINCGTQGASIYYTTNGATPTASSTLYSAPFEVSTATTVKAIAIKGDLQSEVAEAAYEFGTATEVANIAAYQGVADDTKVKFTNPVTVIAQYNKRLFVQDNTGNMFIYGETGQTYKNGDVIPAGFTGTKVTYNGEPELSVYNTDNFQAGTAGTAVTAETIQAIDVEADLFGHLVYIPGATLAYTTSSSGAKNLSSITDNSGTAVANNSMGINASTIDYEATYNVTAVIGSYKAKDAETVTYEVWPVTLEKVGGTTPDPTDGVATIAEYKNLADGATFTFTGEVVVTYRDANDQRYLYIKDATGSALIYGSGFTFNQGDVLAAGWTGEKDIYNGLSEIKNAAGLTATGTTQTVTPVEMTTADIITANENIYCVLRGAKITEVNNRNFTFEDGNAGYNQFNSTVTLPSDLTIAYDIEGFMSINRNNPQFIPTRFLTEVTIPKVADIAELFTKNSGVNYEIEADITAIYQNGSNLYVQDANGTQTLVYGYLSNTFENGDIISGAQASWSTYQDAPQLIPVGSTFVKASTGTAVQPTVYAIEDLGTDMVHNYVKLEGVTLVNDSTNYATATDETGSITIFNKFSNNVTMAQDGTCDITGFLSLYKGNLQLYPVEFGTEETPAFPEGDVTGDNKVDVADVNAVINIILKTKTTEDYPGNADIDGDGKVDVSDVNAIINIILKI